MSHLMYAAEVAKKKIIQNKIKEITKQRHWNSKHYKKNTMTGSQTLDLENPDHEIMYNMAVDWWNSWENYSFIKDMIDGFNDADGDKKKLNKFLDDKYHSLARIVDHWLDLITKDTFIIQFTYCIPSFFIPWYNEYELNNRNRISGELQIEILNIFGKRKKVKHNELLRNLELVNFESTNIGIIKKMCNKGLLIKEKLTEYKEQYYSMNENISSDELGWYINKGVE